MNKAIFSLLSIALSLCSVELFAGEKMPMEEIRTRLSIQSKPELGKWCDDIDACVALAEKESIPVLAAWGNASGGCGHCVQFIEALETFEFRDWAESRKILLCYGDGKIDEKSLKVKDFTEEGPNTLHDYPWVCVYWPKGTSRPVRYNFSGLIGSMPVKTGSTRAGCLIASVEKFIKGYTYIDPSGGPVDFTIVPQSKASAANPYLYAKRTASVMLCATDGDLINRSYGTVALSFSAKNRITAKYSGVSAKSLSFSGTWSTIDLLSGEVKGALEKQGSRLLLVMSREGVVSAMLEPSQPFFAKSNPFGSIDLNDNSFGLGSYTAVLRCKNLGVMNGFGYLQLGIAGSVTQVKGVLPDGTNLSGKFTHGVADNLFLVPVFKNMSNMMFAGRIAIDGDVVASPSGEYAYYYSPQFASQYMIEGMIDVDIFGGISAVGQSLSEFCDEYGISRRWEIKIDTSDMVDSDYGQPIAGSSFIDVSNGRMILEDRQGSVSSVSYNKAQGLVSGKANLWFDTGIKLVGTMKCALVAPEKGTDIIGYGMLQVKDSIYGSRVTRTLAVTIISTK